MEGFLKGRIEGVESINSKGEPVISAQSWTDPIECKYKMTSQKTIGKESEGEFRQAVYEITTNVISFRAKLIQLLNSDMEVLAEKEVQSLDYLEAVQKLRILI